MSATCLKCLKSYAVGCVCLILGCLAILNLSFRFAAAPLETPAQAAQAAAARSQLPSQLQQLP